MPNHTTRPWREYTAVDGHLGTDERVANLFGFPPDVLSVVMWETYGDVLPNTNARKGEKQAYFALAYRFLKLGPTRREMYSVLHTPQTGHVGTYGFKTHIVPIILALAEHANMIRWENGLDPTNHHLAFPVSTTGIVDCFLIRVLTPRKWSAKTFLYAPKYKCHHLRRFVLAHSFASF